MSDSFVMVLLPLLPMSLAVLTIFFKQVFKADISRAAILAALLFLIAGGAYLAFRFWRAPEPVYVPLGLWDYSTVLHFDASKVYFILALIIPAALCLGFHRLLGEANLRIVFLFFLCGCSGIVVTGDVFTFFIFYEMMIMSAYVLITVRNDFYAGIKYMIIGSVSSAFLLAGIILLYSTAGTFQFSFVEQVGELAVGNVKFLMLLFSMAFFVKSAFFPASSWAATCHSATNPLVSAFLSSFTIFSGIYGLVFLVLKPAAALGYTPIFDFLRLISILTVSLPAVFVFFEPELKRCVAGSTVFSIGFIGILLSHQLYDYALTYMVIHAIYKSAMFLLLDRVQVRGLEVYGTRLTLFLYVIGIVFTAGFFPSLIYFLKYAFIGENPLYRLLVYVSMFLVFGSFFKFRFHHISAMPAAEGETAGDTAVPGVFSAVYILLLGAAALFFPYYTGLSLSGLGFDFAFLLMALFFSRRLYLALPRCRAFDIRYVFIGLNVELFLIMLLFFGEIIALRHLLP